MISHSFANREISDATHFLESLTVFTFSNEKADVCKCLIFDSTQDIICLLL